MNSANLEQILPIAKASQSLQCSPLVLAKHLCEKSGVLMVRVKNANMVTLHIPKKLAVEQVNDNYSKSYISQELDFYNIQASYSRVDYVVLRKKQSQQIFERSAKKISEVLEEVESAIEKFSQACSQTPVHLADELNTKLSDLQKDISLLCSAVFDAHESSSGDKTIQNFRNRISGLIKQIKCNSTKETSLGVVSPIRSSIECFIESMERNKKDIKQLVQLEYFPNNLNKFHWVALEEGGSVGYPPTSVDITSRYGIENNKHFKQGLRLITFLTPELKKILEQRVDSRHWTGRLRRYLSSENHKNSVDLDKPFLFVGLLNGQRLNEASIPRPQFDYHTNKLYAQQAKSELGSRFPVKYAKSPEKVSRLVNESIFHIFWLAIKYLGNDKELKKADRNLLKHELFTLGFSSKVDHILALFGKDEAVDVIDCSVSFKGRKIERFFQEFDNFCLEHDEVGARQKSAESNFFSNDQMKEFSSIFTLRHNLAEKSDYPSELVKLLEKP